MRKRRKKNKTVKHKKIINKRNRSLKYSILALIFFVILFLGFVNFFDSNTIRTPIFDKQVVKKSNLITPYLSISPKATETPVPLTGFCLKVPVLMYHHIQPQNNAKQLGQTALSVDSSIFDSQMQYLSQNGYTPLFANELVNALLNQQSLPAKSIVITMDDGYEDNFIYALPILQKYNLKANIMLSTGLMNNSNMLSWDEVKSLKSSGLIYFTNHTWAHQSVIRGFKEKISLEIDTGQKQIQENTGQTVNIFTYPYGEHNKTAEDILREKGYLGAFSEIPGQYQCNSFIMALHRTRVGNSPLSYYGL
jgi:peptidoglycan/xylan/chitin deacetylase (PgdA/CDA1 family)